MHSFALLRRAGCTRLIGLLAGLAALGPAWAELPELEPVPLPRPGTVEDVTALQIEIAHRTVTAQSAEGGDPRALAEAYDELGQIYAAYELWDAAGTCLENAVKLAPDVFGLHHLLAYVEERSGDPASAVRSYERALEIAPDSAVTWLRLGTARLALDLEEAAREALGEALRRDPSSAAAHFALGRLAARAGDDEAAVLHFEAALSHDPAAGRIHLPLAQVYRRLGKTEEARRHLEQRGDGEPLVADPLVDGLSGKANGAAFHKSRGDQLVLAERFPEAVDAYRQAVATEPSNFAYRKSLALTLYHVDRPAEAEQQLEAALRVAPATPDVEKAQVVYTLGGMAANRGDLETAARRFEEAAGLDPNLAEAWLQLGNLRTREEDYAAAVELYTRALSIRPELAEAIFHRATAWMDLGRFAEAVPELRRLLSLRPGYPRAEELLRIAEERAAGAGPKNSDQEF